MDDRALRRDCRGDRTAAPGPFPRQSPTGHYRGQYVAVPRGDLETPLFVRVRSRAAPRCRDLPQRPPRDALQTPAAGSVGDCRDKRVPHVGLGGVADFRGIVQDGALKPPQAS